MRQGYCKLTVVLLIYETNEGDIRYTCSPLWVTPGAARAEEIWRGYGTLDMGILWLLQESNQLYLREVEVKEDHWGIRTKPDKLERADLGSPGQIFATRASLQRHIDHFTIPIPT